MAEQRKKLRLGELLVQQGLITTDQLRIGLTEQKGGNTPLGRQLVRLGFVTEAAIRDAMARTVGQESIDLSQVVADAEALRLVPQDFARRHRLLPIAWEPEERALTIATSGVFNVVALDQLRAMLGQRVELKTFLAAEAQLEDFIDQFYGFELSVDGILREIETGEIDYQSLQAIGDRTGTGVSRRAIRSPCTRSSGSRSRKVTPITSPPKSPPTQPGRCERDSIACPPTPAAVSSARSSVQPEGVWSLTLTAPRSCPRHGRRSRAPSSRHPGAAGRRARRHTPRREGADRQSNGPHDERDEGAALAT